MKISRQKIDICLARQCMNMTALAKKYGVTRSRMSTLINQEEVGCVCLGKLAKALNVDVTEIMAD